MARITIDPEMACEQIALEPDACCEYICFEVGDYSPTFVTDLPDYSGVTTVTPSMDAQTLETANTALHDNITVEAIPYDEVEAATPVISVDSGGKVTATTNQQGGIVESSTKSAEYQQPTVEQATPNISVASDGVITATATQTGGFVAGGSKTATLAQETVEQATPTISVDNAGKITASATQTAGFVAAGTKSAELQQQTVEQATPSISVASDGTVTAEAIQTAGFVTAGTKSASYSLPAQAASTITPSTAAQTAVPAGKWTTGAVEVAAMPTAAQAVPSLSMSGGTITATAEQQAGYVEAGIKQAQMSLPTATAATIIPSTASQQAIGAGVFALGSIGVAPIPSEYIVPSGTSEITHNGTFDVTQYAAASVAVSGDESYQFINDGKTYFYIDVFNDAVKTVPLAFGQTVANGVIVDWGDGSTPETFPETAITNHTHTYADKGEYTITLDVTSGNILYGGDSSSSVFAYGTALTAPSTTSLLLRAVEIGSHGASAQTLGSRAFIYHTNIVFAALSDAITHIADRVFSQCAQLSTLRLSNALVSAGDFFISSNTGLTELILPDTIQTLGQSSALYNVTQLHLPSNMVSSSSNGRIVNSMLSLQKLIVPATITNIGAYGFQANTSMIEYHFLATTPPSLANANAFNGMRSDCVIYVPQESVQAYKNASNWSAFASQIVGE